MELFDTLADFGLTTKVLQIIIFGAIGIFIVGLYWRFIVVGAGILFCAYVFASPTKLPTLVDNNAVVVEKVKPEDVAPHDFLVDCQHYNNVSKSECEQMWKERL